jgi:hypothetical protein
MNIVKFKEHLQTFEGKYPDYDSLKELLANFKISEILDLVSKENTKLLSSK